MKHLCDPLVRRLLPRLGEDAPRSGGVKAWLREGSFYVTDPINDGEIVLKNVGLTEIVPYLSFDYERFALSSLESYLFSREVRSQTGAVAWSLIKAYYAAFFGAHAIMRATGRGNVQMDSGTAVAIIDIANIYGVALGVPVGNYDFRLTQHSDRTLDLILTSVDGRGSAHEGFWKSFYNFLSGLADEVAANSEQNASLTIGAISEVQAILASNGMNAGTWLSFIRNQINYRHEYGVWFPYTGVWSVSSMFSKIPSTDGALFRLDLDASKKAIDAFTSCCLSLAVLNAQLSQALCLRKGVGRYQRLTSRLMKEAA